MNRNSKISQISSKEWYLKTLPCVSSFLFCQKVSNFPLSPQNSPVPTTTSLPGKVYSEDEISGSLGFLECNLASKDTEDTRLPYVHSSVWKSRLGVQKKMWMDMVPNWEFICRIICNVLLCCLPRTYFFTFIPIYFLFPCMLKSLLETTHSSVFLLPTPYNNHLLFLKGKHSLSFSLQHKMLLNNPKIFAFSIKTLAKYTFCGLPHSLACSEGTKH